MVFRCNGVAQMVCTSWCIICLFLLVVGTITTHNAFSTLIPAIVDMPENLREGFDTVLNFDRLEASAANVKNFSKQALEKCGSDPTLCGGGGAGPPLLFPNSFNDTADVTAEVEGVEAAFTDVLDEIQNVTTDKYLGIDDFSSTSERLATMKAELAKLKGENGTTPCSAVKEAFCELYENGDELVNGMDEVRTAIDEITENDGVKQFEDYSQNLKGLHLIPYIGWLGVAFYLCFFMSGNVLTICRGGSCGACVACSCHALFFTIFYIISLVIAAVAIAGSVMARDYAFEEPFPGKPTLQELVEHIEVKFPEFYDLVLKNFIEGLESVRRAFLINAAASILLSIHTIFSCCCGIYNEAAKASQ